MLPPGRLIHVAVFAEPFLSSLLEGKKTLESRFSMRRLPPYGYAQAGDLIAAKRTSGPVVAFCKVLRVKNLKINIASWRELRKKYAQDLCAPESFWHRDKLPAYGTLLWIGKVQKMEPVYVGKVDRRGWVALGSRGSGA
jgi:hypothetical protein